METVVRPVVTEQFVYQVFEISYEPRYKAQQVIYKSVSFLEAVDFAAEFVEDAGAGRARDPAHGWQASETVWTYSKERAAAAANARTPLVASVRLRPHALGRRQPAGPSRGTALARALVGSPGPSRTSPKSTPSTHSPWRQ